MGEVVLGILEDNLWKDAQWLIYPLLLKQLCFIHICINWNLLPPTTITGQIIMITKSFTQKDGYLLAKTILQGCGSYEGMLMKASVSILHFKRMFYICFKSKITKWKRTLKHAKTCQKKHSFLNKTVSRFLIQKVNLKSLFEIVIIIGVQMFSFI